MNIGTVSKATSGKLLRDGVGRILYGLFQARRYHLDVELNWTELNWTQKLRQHRPKDTKTKAGMCWRVLHLEGSCGCIIIIIIIIIVQHSRCHVYADCYWKLILLRIHRMGSALTDYVAYSQDGFSIDRLCSIFTGCVQYWQIMFYIHRMCSMLTDYGAYSQDGLNVDRLCSIFTLLQDVFNIDRLCSIFTGWVQHWPICCIWTGCIAYSQLMTGCAS